MQHNPTPGTVHLPPSARQTELLPVPKQGIITVRFLGPCAGILTHWEKSRRKGEKGIGYACPGEQHCQPAIHRLSTCWKGYAPVDLWEESPHRRWHPWVLEITERLWDLLKTETLRGQMWKLFRVTNERGNVEVSGSLLELVEADELRTDIDIKPVVCRVFRTTLIAWGAKPVMPAAQIVGPSYGAPPPTASSPLAPHLIEGTPEYKAAKIEAMRHVREQLTRSNGNGHKGGES